MSADLEGIHNGTNRVEILRTIGKQEVELVKQSTQEVTCPCGNSGPVKLMFRCFYCEIIFCPPCAERHFEEEE